MNALPVLTLGRKPPLALEAYRAKIGLAKESAPITSRKDHPGRLEVVIPKQDTSAPVAPKKARKWRRPPASTLAWPRCKDRFPLIEIPGEPVAADKVTPHKDAKATRAAAWFWVRRVAGFSRVKLERTYVRDDVFNIWRYGLY
jgi:hypothetical protein